MTFHVQKHLNTLHISRCPIIEQLSEYIHNNFPDILEKIKGTEIAYQLGTSCVSFRCHKNYFSFHSNDSNSLDVVDNILPQSKRKADSVEMKYDEEYAMHAVKVAINYSFNPNKVVYTNIQKAVFLSRPNRFIAHIEINGERHICHVKNTGRCKELLIPGSTVYVKQHSNPKRKTNFSLISVLKGDMLINIDSHVPNKAMHKWLLQGNLFEDAENIKPEYNYGDSRIDFFIEAKDKKILLEVKGVTLEDDGVAMFPDAPTERGVHHIHQLIKAKAEGYESYIVFVIQMNTAKYFAPNYKTHPEFGEALKEAKEKGVHILAYTCYVTPDSIAINNSCPIKL